MKIAIGCLTSLLLLIGCSQESRLVTQANGNHDLRARWSLKVHPLRGGAPEDYQIEVCERGTVFRAHVNSTLPSEEGPFREECDILCDGKQVWQFNRRLGDSDESQPNTVYTIKDPLLVESLRFWRIPERSYQKVGSETLNGRSSVHLKTIGQDITQATIEVDCWIDPTLGYLLQRKNSNGGELYGGQMECLEVQPKPHLASDYFAPPSSCQPEESPPQLWGSGFSI